LTERRSFTFLVDEDDSGERLDSFLSAQLPELSRSRIQKAIRAGEVTVGGAATLKPAQKVHQGEEIRLAFGPPKPLEIVPEPIPLDIVYEDDQLLVVNKPPGMVVHPAPGHETGTLVHALLAHVKSLSGIGGILRPGIVHRLDAGTSGLLVVAKSDEAHISLSRQLMERSMHRVYCAIVWGELPSATGTIDLPIGRSPRDRKKMTVLADGGKEALTTYYVIDTFPPFQYIRLTLGTGRTHQIRVHLSRIGHPVLGDPVYGGRKPRRGALPGKAAATAERALRMIDRQALHAEELSFMSPATGKPMTFTAPPPEDFRRVLEFLESARA
jgi:23S rRNA pseudouridine1911/1915/1917 synthase